MGTGGGHARSQEVPLRELLQPGDESWLPKQPSPTEPNNPMELPGRLLAQEKEMIEAALKESSGRIFGPKGAAARLGIPRSTLESKIRSLKIDKNRFRTLSGI